MEERNTSEKTDTRVDYSVSSSYQSYDSLADVGYGVHPAANANLIAYIWRVAELMHYSNVIGIGSLEELPLQCDCINLKRGRNKEMECSSEGKQNKGRDKTFWTIFSTLIATFKLYTSLQAN